MTLKDPHSCHAKKVLFCYPIPARKGGYISSKEFLDWAKADLRKDSGKRARGNALGNIKKAIHCRIDEIINLTHIVFAKDWNWFSVKTEEKIRIIKDLGIRGGAITKIITDDRNKYEHKYKLPSIDTVRAYLETAELWLDDSYKTHCWGRIGIFGLPVRSVDKAGDEVKMIVVSDEPKDVKYFWDSKKVLLTSKGNALENVENDLHDMAWKEILSVEKDCVRGVIAENIHFLPPRNMTKTFKTYNQRARDGFSKFFHLDIHIGL